MEYKKIITIITIMAIICVLFMGITTATPEHKRELTATGTIDNDHWFNIGKELYINKGNKLTVNSVYTVDDYESILGNYLHYTAYNLNPNGTRGDQIFYKEDHGYDVLIGSEKWDYGNYRLCIIHWVMDMTV
ncbi:MAG: hypothetical protein PHY59_04345 [Methanobacterium sp.]|nr:hypothetical protein [Methanobacterium sp.]